MLPQKTEKTSIFFWECIVSENVHNQPMGGIGNSTVGRKVSGPCKYHIILSPQGFSGVIYNTGWGTFPDYLRCSLQVMKE